MGLGAIALGTIALGFLVAQMRPSCTIPHLPVALGQLLIPIAGTLASTRRGR